jgi:hypothetical protein
MRVFYVHFKEFDMNTLHPIFQQALAPFVQYKPIKRITPTETFHYTLCSVDLVCQMDYEAASGDGWNEPREKEAAYLCEALCNGKDISELFSNEQREEIEAAFLEQQE